MFNDIGSLMEGGSWKKLEKTYAYIMLPTKFNDTTTLSFFFVFRFNHKHKC